MADMEKVVELGASEKPIAEVPPRERLGTLLLRYRTAANKSIEEAADRISQTAVVLDSVEKHQLTLPAGELQQLAAFYNVRYDLLLDAARDWHNAIWTERKQGGGVQMTAMTAETRSLARQEEHELELALIRSSDELVFLSNVLREGSIRAEQAAMNIRELLERRGVEVPGLEPLDGPPQVVCEGPRHSTDRVLVRGRDFVVRFKPDGDDSADHYFCSRQCADQWSQRASS